MDTLPQSITIDKGQLPWIILAVAAIIGLKAFLWSQFKAFCAEHTTNVVFWRGFGGQCFALVIFNMVLVAIVGYAIVSGWVEEMMMEMMTTSLEPLLDISYPPIPTAPPIHCPDGQSNNCHAPYFYNDVEISLVDFILQCTLQRHQIKRGKMPGYELIAQITRNEQDQTHQTMGLHHHAQRLYADHESEVNTTMHRALQLHAKLSWSRNLPAGHAEKQLGYAPLNESSIMCDLFTALFYSRSTYIEELVGLGLNSSLVTMFGATRRTVYVAEQQWVYATVSNRNCWTKGLFSCNITHILTDDQLLVKDAFESMQIVKMIWIKLAIHGYNRYFEAETRTLAYLGAQRRGLCATAHAEDRMRRNGESYVAKRTQFSASSHGEAGSINSQGADGVWYVGKLIRRPAHMREVKVDLFSSWVPNDTGQTKTDRTNA